MDIAFLLGVGRRGTAAARLQDLMVSRAGTFPAVTPIPGVLFAATELQRPRREKPMDAAAEDVSPQPRDDDHSLVKRAQAGDTGAMADLLDRHFDYVHHLCRRILYNPDDAEDAGQQSLMHAARKIFRSTGGRRFARGCTG